ncbi:hypothetical protein [Gordonia polyisoprenivorans]|uniref:hypothetical protein n=1 Tax=Gordonia polyisoprenivorans TaxID=84595 RepID=UPI002300593E|nr:hypothetical protein [Gordonia polyisoprenivorans]WCB36681.1 hypothetical protein PHA63_21905 [Gordonia polyisoprenivorans]
MGERKGAIRRWAASLVTGTAVVAGVVAGTGSASAAPAGPVDAGVPFSSVVYGTGCTYNLTVPVNSVGMVSFYEQRQGFAPILIGRASAYQLIATVNWTPRRLGDRMLYAVQNGVKSPITIARVHQGYGSGGLCFAL